MNIGTRIALQGANSYNSIRRCGKSKSIVDELFSSSCEGSESIGRLSSPSTVRKELVFPMRSGGIKNKRLLLGVGVVLACVIGVGIVSSISKGKKP